MASVGLHQQEYRHVKGGTPMHNGSPTKDSLHWYAKCIRWGRGKNPDYSNYIPHILSLIHI